MTALRARLLGLYQRRAFLIRLIATTLTVLCIPLSIFSYRLVEDEARRVREAATEQLGKVAATAASQLDAYVRGMDAITVKLLLTTKLHEGVLSTSVQSESDALEIIRYYGAALPFIKEYGLWANGSVYAVGGKYRPRVFAALIAETEADEFAALLRAYDHAGFAPWKGANILYVSPLRGGTASVAVFVISPDALLGALSSVLAGQYQLAQIQDRAGQTIYQDASAPAASDDNYVITDAASAGGLRIRLYANKSVYQLSVDRFTSNVRSVTITEIIICAGLLAAVILLNYRPIARLYASASKAGPPRAAHRDEVQFVHSALDDLVREKSRLSDELSGQRMLVWDGIAAKLLAGRRATEEEVCALRLHWPVYYVAVMRLPDVKGAADLVAGNEAGGALQAIEMYEDGQLAFLCGCADASLKARDDLLASLRGRLADPAIPIGVSAPCAAPGKLFLAYLEAGRALAGEISPAATGRDNAFDGPAAAGGDDEALLIHALKEGDEFAVNYASRAFDAIARPDAPGARARYACFQLIDLYRRAARDAGAPLPMERLAQMLQSADVGAIRAQFLTELELSLARSRAEKQRAAERVSSDIAEFIARHYTNPSFCMNDVSEHLGVSVFTASRLLANITGENFRKYVNDLRLDYACELLRETELTVTEIAEKVGFTSPSYFISVFRKARQTTPTGYKKALAREKAR